MLIIDYLLTKKCQTFEIRKNLDFQSNYLTIPWNLNLLLP